ncbi:MAG: hypothetical protein ACLQGJ_09185 [Candidatus Dormibacteria bacterium]
MTNKLGLIGRQWLVGGAVIAGAVTVFVASTQGVLASGQPSQPSSTSTPTIVQPTSAQMALVSQKFGFLATNSLWSQFTGVDGALALKEPVATLQAEHNLTAAQAQSLQSILTDYQQDVAAGASFQASLAAGVTASFTGSTAPTVADSLGGFGARNEPVANLDADYKLAPAPVHKASLDLSTSGTVIYFTYSNVLSFLYGAALAGPWAIAAAITAVASIMGGPVGTVIGIIVSIIGGATIANLAYLILQAVSQGRGIYFGITWDWIFPNWTEGTWCGCS